MHGSRGTDIAVVELFSPQYDPVSHSVTYEIEVLAKEIPASTTLEILRAHVAARGRVLELPPVVDPDLPLPVPLEQVPPRSRAFLKVLIDVSEVTRACGGVLPTSLPLLAERFGVPAASDTEAYRRSLDYWADERAGGREAVEAG